MAEVNVQMYIPCIPVTGMTRSFESVATAVNLVTLEFRKSRYSRSKS